MLVLVASWNNRINVPGVSIEKLVTISFVFDLELFNTIFCFVADEYIEEDKMAEVIDRLIDRLRFVANLNLVIFEQWVLFSEITDFEAS